MTISATLSVALSIDSDIIRHREGRTTADHAIRQRFTDFLPDFLHPFGRLISVRSEVQLYLCIVAKTVALLIRYIVGTMRCMHRLAGLLSAFSLVTALVVTSGFACELPVGADHMAGMSMPNAVDAPSPFASTGSLTGEAPAPDPAPCGVPSAPSACQSMVACAPTAVASQRIGISATLGAMVRVASATVLPPSSETKAPELPPPRA